MKEKEEKFKREILDEFKNLRKLSNKEQDRILLAYFEDICNMPLGKSFILRELSRLKKIRKEIDNANRIDREAKGKS